MIFNSFDFLIFMTAIVAAFYVSPVKLRMYILLVGSYIFYMWWSVPFVLLLVFVTVVNYGAAILVTDYYSDERRRLAVFTAALVISFGILFVFKYLPLLDETLTYMFAAVGVAYTPREFDLILPLGISFYTFQAVGYTIDVYRGRTQAERSFVRFSLFITFFPPLIAGPIERASGLMPQLVRAQRLDMDNIMTGLKFILFGLFKKVVIADRIAIAVNTVYGAPENFAGLALVAATILFAFQIYCDFSGYSDMAVGCAKLFGIDLTLNFRQPYLSRGVGEFWRRWHISLSSWFKDYVYFPLGGSKVGPVRYARNIMVTFLISGIWHGASWTFIAWGALHGIYLLVETVVMKPVDGLLKFMSIDNLFVVNAAKTAITFGLVCFGWILFRAETLDDGIFIMTNLFYDIDRWGEIPYVFRTLSDIGLGMAQLLASIVCIILLIITDIAAGTGNIHEKLMDKPADLRFAFYLLIGLLIIALGVFHDGTDFIYFQF
ncbi:MAG: MBOAT family protein [Defluviitaleaceae bacterium]|nr:MBOAT family protein [Defluviitaleaceae bacterium]